MPGWPRSLGHGVCAVRAASRWRISDGGCIGAGLRIRQHHPAAGRSLTESHHQPAAMAIVPDHLNPLKVIQQRLDRVVGVETAELTGVPCHRWMSCLSVPNLTIGLGINFQSQLDLNRSQP